MLIAPFAGPAMNVAIATARGDSQLLWRGILRYFAALAVTIAVAGMLSLIMRQNIATSLMIERSQISSVAVLLPLAAGAAGALNLVQSERSSLVSGAATGMLVAASLAPPAGIVGMASAIGRWDLVVSGLFLLLLQLVGINFTAALLFHFFGLSARGVRYKRGKRWLFPVALVFTVAAIASLLTWQFTSSPDLQRSTLAQRANAQIEEVVSQSPLVNLVEANVRFRVEYFWIWIVDHLLRNYSKNRLIASISNSIISIVYLQVLIFVCRDVALLRLYKTVIFTKN
jgi:uncharacterized membrane protein